VRTVADVFFADLINILLQESARVTTRNSEVYRVFAPPRMDFGSLPLVTFRKTAWKKALREMEWFMSGDARCPLELRDWWEGQLDVDNNLIYGYPHQFRQFSGDWGHGHDQVTETLAGLRTSPFGRRHVLTLWNPGEMAGITHANGNPRTPTTCHGTVMQFSVSPDKEGNPETLNMYHYQRSSDVLLGLPHNLVQYWALLTYFAHHSGLKVGRLVYQLGDAHLYAEESHLKVAIDIKRAEYPYYAHEEKSPVLTYQPSGEPDAPFIAADFNIAWPEGEQPDPPASTIRPKLL
jgi:thymidylate synthase